MVIRVHDHTLVTTARHVISISKTGRNSGHSPKPMVISTAVRSFSCRELVGHPFLRSKVLPLKRGLIVALVHVVQKAIDRACSILSNARDTIAAVF